MDKIELDERLALLQETEVITDKAVTVTVRTFERLARLLAKEDIVQGEMLFTHLSSAITRLERGEEIVGPSPEVLQQVKAAGYSDRTECEIAFIEQQYGNPLPDEEKNYLHLHYATVFQLNEGK
ncbi:hypothetical protein GCM10011391_37930 [Pullulanibacillus camelliae]|uniref:PRD domain-containing protein n=1 Tax=Pullulanibacillus camelliae TaxID=1707096 RepID=A0A8J3E1W9_9BACL|nr:PRD domain-containing protein [Pullulanibacillus camelliae]GGE55320.1 hypothetical protein GCM10011391_37930 [Pullulanibacillus camelliae]